MEDQSRSLCTETMHRFLTVYRYLRRSSRQLDQAGIGGRKMAALRYLIKVGSCTVGQLRRTLYISISSTSELIARLEAKGYVTRARSEHDNRVVIVSLTEAGCEVAQRTPLQGVPRLREQLKTLPPERLARIHDAMTDIMELLEIDSSR